MPSLSYPADQGQAVAALETWLVERGYNRVCIFEILDHLRLHGELSSLVPQWLDREHLEAATEVYVEALPAVPAASREWDMEGFWSAVVPPELEPDHDGE